MHKPLICVQGINDEPDYLVKTVRAMPYFKDYEIHNSPIETIFDKALKLPIRIPWVSEHLGDIISYFKKKEVRKAVCRLTRQKIKEFEPGTVKLVTHSLGSIVALCSGSQKKENLIHVDKLIMLASPMGFGLNIKSPSPLPDWFDYRDQVLDHVEEYSKNFTANQIVYMYSENDFVSKKLTQRCIDILQRRSSEPLLIMNEADNSHNHVQFLDDVVKYGI